jgi:uncharacterized protein YprB with RNaseH-like and TPR domain
MICSEACCHAPCIAGQTKVKSKTPGNIRFGREFFVKKSLLYAGIRQNPVQVSLKPFVIRGVRSSLVLVFLAIDVIVKRAAAHRNRRMTSHSITHHQLLRRTFVHLKGVGARSERHLWKLGITDWEQLLRQAPQLFKAKRLDDVRRSLELSLEAWQRNDLYYFDRVLPGQERWRLIPGGFPDIAYFDIEAANGGMPPATESTAIAFFFRGELHQEFEYSRKRDLLNWIMDEAALFCTYNGAAYDLPFLSAEFGMKLEKAHIDLCPWLRRQGFQGGLKAIQRTTSHLHQRSSMDLDGYDAVRLWRMYEEALPGALETLLTYNAEDVLILEPLLVDAYNREVELHPELNLQKLQSAPIPPLKTRMDPRIYELLRSKEPASTD